MFFYEGFSCPVCGKAFREYDDIVACPDCGAPHHRDCWKEIGHCALADKHGTPEQWSREKAGAAEQDVKPAGTRWVCEKCGAENPEFAEFCARCGSEKLPAAEPPKSSAVPPVNDAGFYEYSPFRAPVAMGLDPLGGVPADEPIDGVAAKELAVFVGSNSHYYIPRFREMAGSAKVSWNWAAFLFYPYWLFYRKSYLVGTLALIFKAAMSCLSAYVLNMVSHLVGAVSDYGEFAERIWALGDDPTLRTVSMILMLISVGEIAARIFFGLFGNRLYMRTAVNRIRSLKQSDPARFAYRLRVVGGISLTLGLMSYLVINYLTYLVQLLLK